MGSDLYVMRSEMAHAENAELREKIKKIKALQSSSTVPSATSGVLVTLGNNAQQFMAGADEIKYDLTGLVVLRNGAVVGIFQGSHWMHAERIANFPDSLVQDPRTSIWVINTPEVTNGVPDADPLP